VSRIAPSQPISRGACPACRRHPLQTLTEIKSALAAHGLRPKHRLGQNFLHDHGKLALILDAAAIAPGDLVLEVGPGTGTLTQALAGAGARVVAVEVDEDLAAVLRETLAPHEASVSLVFADVLAGKHAINPAVIDALEDAGTGPLHPAGETPSPNPSRREGDENRPEPVKDARHPFKLVANLPYQIASPLLANLALDHPALSLAVVMVQREVADRLTADPGGKDYGPLGVLIRAAFEVDRVTTLPPGCFWPPPNVHSAVVRLRRRGRPLADDLPALAALLHRLFSRRRKQIGTILGRDTPLPPGVDPTRRPESLSVPQLAALAKLLGDAGRGP